MGSEECIIEMKEEIFEGRESSVNWDWVRQMDNEVKELGRSRSEESRRWAAASIYRIPRNLKKPYSDSYRPQVVSIGPYHHGDPQLVGMEVHKRRALLNFLERTGKSLACYVKALAPAVQCLKNAYPHYMDPHTDGDTFLQMMILDGCFILELMRTTAKLKQVGTTPYAPNDPVFSKHGGIYLQPLLRRDMLMLENQIPLLVLIKLKEAEEGGGVGKNHQQGELIDSILKFFDPPTRDQKNLTQNLRLQTQIKKWPGQFLHILDLYRKSLLLCKGKGEEDKDKNKTQGTQKSCNCLTRRGGGKYRTVEPKEVSKETAEICTSCFGNDHKHPDLMRSATELTEAGIGFKQSKTRYLNDTPWYDGGTLKLPLVTVDDAVQSLFLNLMAFERLHVGDGDQVMNEVTSYVFFMDRLIDSDKDVRLLHWSGIIENALGSDDDVARLFNRLSTNMCPDSVDVWAEQDKLAMTYRKPGRRCLAYAKHNYFTNAWVTLTIVAAVLIFTLTVAQTVYAVLDYHKKK